MLAVLVIGGSIAFGAPLVPDLAKAPATEARTIQASPTTTPSVQPSRAEATSPRARPHPKPDSPKSKVKVKDVPDSGSGMEIILPGTGILGDVEPTVVDV